MGVVKFRSIANSKTEEMAGIEILSFLYFFTKFNIISYIVVMGKRIVRTTGYSNKRDVEFNPAIENVVRAFKSDGVDKSKKMKAGWLDYIAFIFVIIGFLSILTGITFFGILIPIGLFLEIVAISIKK